MCNYTDGVQVLRITHSHIYVGTGPGEPGVSNLLIFQKYYFSRNFQRVIFGNI